MDGQLPPDFDPNDPFNARRLLPNLVCRVVFGILAMLLAIVPGRLLWRNGEFAAVVFILATTLLNLFNVVNALIWRDDNLDSWWDGRGWCDIQAYISNPLIVVYAASNFAIMHNLATQVGLLRASPLTVKEKRRRNLLQAAIIFTVPIVEIAMTFPLLSRRYFVGTVRGCLFSYDHGVPTIVVFFIWPIIFSVGAAVYAGLTWMRFREVEKTTRVVLSSTGNSGISSRAHRTRRRLFLMSASIIIPYMPLQVTIAALAIKSYLPLVPYSFDRVHNHAVPYPWDAIIFLPSFMLDFTTMYSAYIPIITIIPVFWFFGKTKDAINTYREFLVKLGLGKLFPGLNEEYDPDRRHREGTASTTSRLVSRLTGMVKSRSGGRQGPLLPTVTEVSGNRSASKSITTTSHGTAVTTGGGPDLDGPSPFPDYSHLSSERSRPSTTTTPHRNPWLFRTTFDIQLPFSTGTKATAPSPPTKSKPAATRTASSANQQSGAGIRTQIWSDEEAGGPAGASSSAVNEHVPSEHGSGSAVVVQTDIRRSSENVSEEK